MAPRLNTAFIPNPGKIVSFYFVPADRPLKKTLAIWQAPGYAYAYLKCPRTGRNVPRPRCSSVPRAMPSSVVRRAMSSSAISRAMSSPLLIHQVDRPILKYKKPCCSSIIFSLSRSQSPDYNLQITISIQPPLQNCPIIPSK